MGAAAPVVSPRARWRLVLVPEREEDAAGVAELGVVLVAGLAHSGGGAAVVVVDGQGVKASRSRGDSAAQIWVRAMRSTIRSSGPSVGRADRCQYFWKFVPGTAVRPRWLTLIPWERASLTNRLAMALMPACIRSLREGGCSLAYRCSAMADQAMSTRSWQSRAR